MDLEGSIVDTNVRIHPSKVLLDFLKTITSDHNVPYNIRKIIKDKDFPLKNNTELKMNPIDYTLNDKDIENLKKIKEIVGSKNKSTNLEDSNNEKEEKSVKSDRLNKQQDKKKQESASDEGGYRNKDKENRDDLYLTTLDIDWLYTYLKKTRNDGEKVPFLHVLLAGVDIEMPKNEVIKRNPVLEERCVKLRAQQEAREYRKMTKTVDNVRMKFPEDSIHYQLKQINRQLIVIGQFILSIFAGFLFGFRGVEWMVGNLDFGFRLLLGVMCALIIALAEIYFIAKKLNEELSVPETVQLGGPVKFTEERTCHGHKISTIDKEHQD